MLQPYGEKVVIKVVSKDVIHKQKVDGVKIVNKHDAIFVQYVIDKMREEVEHLFQHPKRHHLMPL
jgi:acyl-CoA synthetase (NDP forming)